MGDRAYARITVAEKHLNFVAGMKKRGDALSVRNVIEGHGFEEDGRPPIPGTIDFVDEESNWGGGDLHDDLMKCGVPFFGTHGPGGEYDAGELVYSGRGQTVVHVGTTDGCLVCTVDSDTGRPHKSSLANVRRYLRTMKTVQRRMGAS